MYWKEGMTMAVSVKVRLTERTVYARPLKKIGAGEQDEAARRFTDAVNKGILKGAPEGDVWEITDQIHAIRCDFTLRRMGLERACRARGLTAKQALMQLRVFALLWLGKCDLRSFAHFVSLSITEMADSRMGTAKRAVSQSSIAGRYYCEFVRVACAPDGEYLFPEEYREMCLRHLNASRVKQAEYKRDHRNAEDLPDFESFLKFDRVLSDFWANAEPLEKKQYYPIWLLWNLMTILPLRVREFCVTPYDCIRAENGHYYLTIRRTRLKGNADATIHEYYIAGDYDTYEYEVPEYLYQAFDEYRTMTAASSEASGLLFSREFCQKAFGSYAKNDKTAFQDRDMNRILDHFYDEIVTKRNKFTVVSKAALKDRMTADAFDSSMGFAEIMKIRIKHLRHIAVINMILSGCPVTLVRDFCGHADDLMTANYYENASKIVKLASRYYYDISRRKGGLPDASPLQKRHISPVMDPDAPGVLVGGGRCCARDQLTDCARYDADCESCPYYIPDTSIPTKDLEKQFDEEVLFLRKMLWSRETKAQIDEAARHMLTVQKDAKNLALRCWMNLTGNESPISAASKNQKKETRKQNGSKEG